MKSLFLFGILALAFLLLNVNFSSAALCDVRPEANCAGGSQTVLRLSGTSNAQAALKGQPNFPSSDVLCCDFGGGVTSCSGTNKFLGLSGSSGAGNAHGEKPNLSF